MIVKANYFLLLITLHCLQSKRLLKGHGITCHSNRMDIYLEFDESFDGIIFADHAYNDSGCRWEGQHSTQINFSIPIFESNGSYACGIRMLQATGEVTSMLILSPMKHILVDGVTSLQIRCMYVTNDITVTMAGLQIVGMEEQTGIVTGTGSVPALQIQILDGHGIIGDAVRHARVGQPLTLDIVLENTEIYDFYAHSCIAHDGSNNADALVQIIDANGCGIGLSRAIELPVYMTSSSNGNPKHVYIYMYGFQFTSTQFVYFECQIRPCIHSCKRQQCEVNKTALIETTATTITIARTTTAMAITAATTTTTTTTNILKTTKSAARFRRETQVKVVKLLTILEMMPSGQIYAAKFHSNPKKKLPTSLGTTSSQLSLLIALFITLGSVPTIAIMN
ncbi:Zona pellucida-like domain family protein [Brugia pahangi]